ncbi:MAG: deaminase [Candidatus Phytoplasma australasiaticum]|nr:deaminase [Candidatus Phytoplasma australasiaticum]
MKKKHFWFMQEAFIEAKKAFEKGEVPVGAVAVIDDKIVARAHNNTENSQLFFSHAEFLVLIEGSARKIEWDSVFGKILGDPERKTKISETRRKGPRTSGVRDPHASRRLRA